MIYCEVWRHLIKNIISNYHYRNVPLDDALSKKILDRYIDALDPARSYFTQADIVEFDQNATRVDDYLRSSSLNPLFDMFVRFRTRLGERVNYAVKAVDAQFQKLISPFIIESLHYKLFDPVTT